MHRRRFMKLTAAAGLVAVSPWSGRLLASDEFAGHDGSFWLTINLVGGWDTTMFCDPRGSDISVEGGATAINQSYHSTDISEIQRDGHTLRLADDHYQTSGGEDRYAYREGGLAANPTFFQTFGHRMTIINGVDSETNGHTQGERVTWSGSLSRGTPSLAALVAAKYLVDRPAVPMPFVTFGGYDETGDILAPTRLQNLSVFGQITQPDIIKLNGGSGLPFHSPATIGLLDNAMAGRSQRLQAQTRLPSARMAKRALFTARLKERHVKRILDGFDFDAFEALGTANNSFRRQIMLALHGFASGVGISANLATRGWDTHQRNDENQANRLQGLLDGLTYLKRTAEQLGIFERLNIVVASDFGRTPYYNSGSGKDHWSVGSWMTMLNGSGLNNGLRVIGSTDANMQAVPVDPQLQPVATGAKITPGAIHKQLRQIAGIADSPGALAHPLDAPDLPLFGQI